MTRSTSFQVLKNSASTTNNTARQSTSKRTNSMHNTNKLEVPHIHKRNTNMKKLTTRSLLKENNKNIKLVKSILIRSHTFYF